MEYDRTMTVPPPSPVRDGARYGRAIGTVKFHLRGDSRCERGSAVADGEGLRPVPSANRPSGKSSLTLLLLFMAAQGQAP